MYQLFENVIVDYDELVFKTCFVCIVGAPFPIMKIYRVVNRPDKI